MKQQSEDLTQKLAAQAAIVREERAQTNALFASIGEGVIATDEHGNISRINQAALDILGYSSKELIGGWFPEKIVAVREDGSVIENVNRPIIRAFLTGTTINEQMYYRNKDGSVTPVAITVSPIILRGKPIGAIEVFRDISIEIISDRLKTEFISIASHQLRTPLSAINTYTHMLYEGYVGQLQPDQKTYLNTILTAISRMNELISTLLNVTRIEAGTIEVQSEPLHLKKLLREMITELKPQAKEKKITMKLILPKTLPALQSDSLLVREIMSNLISNAIKYTPDRGQVTVTLKTTQSSILFSVADTGYGIPATAQEYIFTKFFRADNILAKTSAGTGLGLYLIKRIADSLSGDVWFESKENKGSTFYCSLPLQGPIERKGKFKLEI